MHSVYIYCDDARKTEGVLSVIQSNFTKIYRVLEEMADCVGRPKEDAILSYHMSAYLPLIQIDDKKEGLSTPKELIKNIFSKEKIHNDKRIEWIENFSVCLVKTFENTKNILLQRDKSEDLGALFVLGRVAPFWPLLIKAWDCDNSSQKSEFSDVVKSSVRFAFRALVAGLRSNTGVEHLRREANQFKKEDFSKLVSMLNAMSENWWDIETKFLRGLDEKHFYGSGNHVKFLLWKYENHLRARNGRHAQHPLTWRDMIEKNGKLQMTVDHILPQNPSDPIEKALLEKDIVIREGKKPKSFRDVYLHCLGNLVLDTRGGNSSSGCRRFSHKTHEDRYGFMQSQDELKSFSEKIDIWDEVSIINRQKKIRAFAEKI